MVGFIHDATQSFEASLYFLGGIALSAGILTLIVINAHLSRARKPIKGPGIAQPS